MSAFAKKMSPYLYQPREVSFETLALCNAACTFCPYVTLERKGARMSDALVQSLIAQMAAFAAPFFVSPFKVNEPLLDARLSSICEDVTANCPHATLRLFTNGQPLTVRALAWITRLPRLAHLWVSLNEYAPERYRALMGLDLATTLRRLDMLHAEVERGRFQPSVVVSRVRDGTENDEGFTRFVVERWPAFTPRLLKRDGWLGYVEPTRSEIPSRPCARWWELSITATGVAALCCMDGSGEYAIGDTNKSSLLDIYNQPALLARRMRHVQRRDVDPCNRCTY